VNMLNQYHSPNKLVFEQKAMNRENLDFDVELIEESDWSVNNKMFSNSTDFKNIEKKSISAYYVDRWIDSVRENTFETVIVDIPNRDMNKDLPEVLPFDRSMVRYVHCSPKDSEFWGECRTKEEVIRVFNSSLRCHKNHGDKIVFRRWNTDIVREYRLFWNTRLCAGSLTHFEPGSVTEELFRAECERIVNYLKTLHVPYYRCVLDIAVLKDSTLVLIEFNSWESNSGCHMFDWRDTEIMYPEIHKNDPTADSQDVVVFRAKLDEDVLEFRMLYDCHTFPLLQSTPFIKGRLLNTQIDKVTVYSHDPDKPSWYILNDQKLYVATDLFLVLFDVETLIPKFWVRHTNRFYPIFMSKNRNGGDVIVAGDDIYDTYLTKQRGYEKRHQTLMTVDTRLINTPFRYGFFARVGDVDGFVRVCSSGRLYFI
ncbi:hypothetical protein YASMINEVIRUS_1550, partial [Yasminevirus sp. GU-2018]